MLQNTFHFVCRHYEGSYSEISVIRFVVPVCFASGLLHRWHCWRRLGAALLAWAGYAVYIISWWGRWKTEAQAVSYSSPPLSWNIAYPILLPWPDAQTGKSVKPTEPRAMWPTRYFGVDTHPAEEREIIDLDGDDTQDEHMSARELSDSIILGASRASRRVPRPRRSFPARAQQRVLARRLHPIRRFISQSSAGSVHVPPDLWDS